MKFRFLFIACFCTLFRCEAGNGLKFNDSTGKGIQFDNSRWQQILKKAKKTGKYIFLDCYTTWCGPCKLMETNVYPLAQIGNYMNPRFISVKIQMDKTPSDDQQTKSSYPDVELIEKLGVPGYPAFFIFSPEGKLVSRSVGYKFPESFLGFISGAIDPNASHPFARYYSMLNEYQKGNRDFNLIPDLIDTATQLNQQDVVDSLSKFYSAHLKTLREQELYNRKTINFLATRIQSSNNRYFHIFYPNEEKINTLKGKDGYAQFVVGQVITHEDIDPHAHFNTGMACSGCVIKKERDPDWESIEKAIAEKYDSSYAEENTLKAKIRWYAEQNDWGNQGKYFTMLIKKYGQSLDANGIIPGNECANFLDCDLNSHCWFVFKYSVDKEQIDAAIKCMEGVIKRYRIKGVIPDGYIDTYANLLYKAGRSQEAIESEQDQIDVLIKKKAVESALTEFRETLERMKTGKPTWPHYIDKSDYFGMGLM